MGATCGKKRNSDRNQQGKEFALARFVMRLRYIFNKNRVVPFNEPAGSRSVSSVISNTAIYLRNNQNKSRHLSEEEKYYQTELNTPCVDQNSTPLLDNVEFNDDLPSARDKSNRKRGIQRAGEETKDAKEKQSIIGIQTCVAKFEKEADKLLSGNRKRRHNKASKIVRTNMSIMFAATFNIEISLPGEVIPSGGASNVTRPQLTVPEIHTKEKKYLDSWMIRQIKKDNLKK